MENPETPVRILVVDDEPDIRNILHILLSSRGYEVDEAENGLRAVELVRAQPDYDLIILDIMLPGEDGLSLCRRRPHCRRSTACRYTPMRCGTGVCNRCRSRTSTAWSRRSWC